MLLDREVSPRHAHAVAAISLATSIYMGITDAYLYMQAI
jgi:hypothetical protein